MGYGDEFLVLSTGRLAEQKGLEYLIRAVPLVPTGGRSLKVLLAGDGPLRDELRSLASKLGVEHKVRFLGFRDDIGDLLTAADLVALPSLWEGLSISLLEAMAAGKPVVTTTIGSNREVTGDGYAALLVPPKDPDRLASAIGHLMVDDLRRQQLGTRAAETQRERYGMDRMLGAYLAEYQLLLRRSTSGVSSKHTPNGSNGKVSGHIGSDEIMGAEKGAKWVG
jgi:glycosyltransferase involved in cell wall biosynthesis